MNLRSLLLATLAGTFALYAWQVVSNTALDSVLPWHKATMKRFPDEALATNAVRAVAPENGLYVAPPGVLAAISLSPDMSDRSVDVGSIMGRQFAIDLIAVAMMILLVSRVRATRIRDVAILFGTAGLAASTINYLSLANWFAFPVRWALVNTVDQAIGWLLAGMAAGAMTKRALRSARAEAPAVIGGDLPAARTAPSRV